MKHNFKEGDRVVVTKRAETHENGWLNSWIIGNMCKSIGKELVIVSRNTHKEQGIELSDGFAYPYFVLKHTSSYKPKTDVDNLLEQSLNSLKTKKL